MAAVRGSLEEVAVGGRFEVWRIYADGMESRIAGASSYDGAVLEAELAAKRAPGHYAIVHRLSGQRHVLDLRASRVLPWPVK